MRFFFYLLLLITSCVASQPQRPPEVTSKAWEQQCLFRGIRYNSMAGARWHKDAFPIKLAITGQVRPYWAAATAEAVSMWNSALGFTAFVVGSGSGQPGTITILQMPFDDFILGREKTHQDTLAITRPSILQRSGYITSAVIVLVDRPGKTPVAPVTVLAHELGHLLGLDHDFVNRRSVMYPQAVDTSAEIQPIDVAYVRAYALGDFHAC